MGSFSSPCSSVSPAKSSNAGDSYIGSFISLISKSEIRYEGILYHLSVQDSIIGLKNVKSYGTEGRKKDGPQISSSDKVYEFILFRGSDIKDLQVKTAPPAQTEEPIPDDPAIIQSHYAGVPLSFSASVGGKTLAESALVQDMPALTSRGYPTALTSLQSVNHVGSKNLSQAAEDSDQSFSMSMYWQGYNGTSINRSNTSQHSIPFQPPSMVSSSLSAQNQMPAAALTDSPIMGLTNASEFATPVPSVASNNSTFSPVQYSLSHDMPSFSSVKTSLPSLTSYTNINRQTVSSVPYSSEDTGLTNVQNVNKAVSDPKTVYTAQSMPYPISSYEASTSSPLLTRAPSLLSPDQLAQSRSHVLSSMVYPDQKNTDPLTPLSSTSLSFVPSPASQEPLLPLPSTVQKFTEEFDFEAMNEKFKKDEVWGYLGKANQGDSTVGTEDNQGFEDREVPCLVPHLDAKPAYKKDEFFDTISCNTLSQGRNGQNRFSNRMTLDNETFGWRNQRSNPGYGGWGAGRGYYYHGRHNGGRGYGYGGRGNGNLPF
ncbi:hypothetical protein P3X46_034354 [Hevea brasiliensis]|uniref:DFDF domain-containing protein n=1 Tax=Hevea brasiliensis TaxID=3981 RepID=A0ABQ9K9T0_HEVBR|nr:decapping 5-like protein [Hevea brasiliensis]KAJ9128905.1 hypothetical protein P3X46_034354 [Hevea brasiliensis]